MLRTITRMKLEHVGIWPNCDTSNVKLVSFCDLERIRCPEHKEIIQHLLLSDDDLMVEGKIREYHIHSVTVNEDEIVVFVSSNEANFFTGIDVPVCYDYENGEHPSNLELIISRGQSLYPDVYNVGLGHNIGLHYNDSPEEYNCDDGELPYVSLKRDNGAYQKTIAFQKDGNVLVEEILA